MLCPPCCFLSQMEGGQPVLYLRSSNRGHRGDVPLQGGRIVFADGEDPSDFHMKIVECRYLKVCCRARSTCV